MPVRSDYPGKVRLVMKEIDLSWEGQTVRRSQTLPGKLCYSEKIVSLPKGQMNVG